MSRRECFTGKLYTMHMRASVDHDFSLIDILRLLTPIGWDLVVERDWWVHGLSVRLFGQSISSGRAGDGGMRAMFPELGHGDESAAVVTGERLLERSALVAQWVTGRVHRVSRSKEKALPTQVLRLGEGCITEPPPTDFAAWLTPAGPWSIACLNESEFDAVYDVFASATRRAF
ncbi:MAG: hypothetical protein KGJ62_07700 [Armatimonadetes bacterium]|nr:hypothetical protein [Armatimonadota bacterium]MDE2207240.1 hypothetical protein [Armatimonadota bacterium]